MTQTIDSILSDFAKVVEDAERVKGQGNGAKVVVTKARTLQDAISQATADSVSLPAGVENLTEAIQALLAASGVQSGEEDRTAGDALATQVGALVITGLLDEDQGTLATSLTDRYKAARITFRKRTGENASPDLGFKLTVKDGEGNVVASTRKHNVNSIRSQVKLAGKHDWDSKNPAFAGLTDAITRVMDGEADHAQGGGYVVDKVAATASVAA